MKFPVLVAALALTSIAFANDDRYTLDLGASVHGGNLKVEPIVTGPAGKTLDYEMKVRREGQGKSSNSSQAGTIHLDDGGQARLASNSVNVSPSDRYVVTVQVMDQGRVVAEKSQQYP
jgi:hypothetical protein